MPVLTARAAGTEGIDAQILGVQRYVHLFGLRHDRHRGGGGVDAALGLGLGHALHPVHTALVLEAVVGPGTIHREHGFFHTAQFGLIQVQQLQRPAVVLGVHGVHPQKAVGKQGGFLAACTAPDLHDDAFAVVDVPGEQQNFEIFFQLCHILTFFADFLLYHLFEVRIGSGFFQQGPGLRQVILRGLQCPVGLHHRLGCAVLLHQPAEQRRVTGGLRLGQPDGKLFKPAAHRIHLGNDIHSKKLLPKPGCRAGH